jgi:hypothetical protein
MEYILRVASGGCNCDVRVNDIPVYVINDDTQSGFAIPINHLLFSSQNNIISYTARPISSMETLYAGTKLYIQLLKAKSFEEREDEELLLEYSSTTFINEKESSKTFEISFHTEISLMVEAYKPVSINDSIIKNLIEEYRQIERLLINRDLSAVTDMFINREKEFAACFNTPWRERLDYFKNYLNELFTGDAEVWEFELPYVKLQTYALGRLIALQYDNKDSAIAIYNPSMNTTTYLDLYFGIKNGVFNILK